MFLRLFSSAIYAKSLRSYIFNIQIKWFQTNSSSAISSFKRHCNCKNTKFKTQRNVQLKKNTEYCAVKTRNKISEYCAPKYNLIIISWESKYIYKTRQTLDLHSLAVKPRFTEIYECSVLHSKNTILTCRPIF